MPKKSWDDIKRELNDAWDAANHGHMAVPREGTGASMMDSDLIPNTGRVQGELTFQEVESRLRELFNLYQDDLITSEDFEQEKAQILQEI